MKTRIAAEFDTIDSAEYVARAVKEISGVNKINIRATSVNTGIKKHGLAIFEYGSFSTQNVALPITVDAYGSVAEPFTSQKAILEVICEQSCKTAVSNKITAYGGLKVTHS